MIKMEIVGNIEKYTMNEGIYFTFRKEPDKDEDYGERLNIPFEIYNKFKRNKIKITIEKIKE